MAEWSLPLLLRLALQAISDTVSDRLVAAGFDDLSQAQASTLAFLDARGAHVSALAARAGMSRQSMAQAVKELERAGYLTREPDPTHGRRLLVHLTDRGRAVRPVAVRAARDVERAWSAQIGPEGLAALRATLATLVGYARDERP